MSTPKDTFVSYIERLVAPTKIAYALKVWAALGKGKPAPKSTRPWASKVVAQVTAYHNAETGIPAATMKARAAKAKAVTLDPEVQKGANLAFKAAHADANDGERMAAGHAARLQFILECVELANASA